MSGVIVQISLDDLYALKGTADVAQIYRRERDDVQKQLDAANQEKKDLHAVAEDLKEHYTKVTDEATIQAAEINQLRQRLIKTEQELAWWTATDTDESPEKKARDFIKQYDLAFADKEVKDACEIIRALLVHAHTKTPEVTA